jgi:DNA polymerase-3 subunit alpha
LCLLRAIAQWHDRGTQALVEYQLDDGTILRATPDHQFMTTDGTMQTIDTIFEQGLDLLKVNAKISVYS